MKMMIDVINAMKAVSRAVCDLCPDTFHNSANPWDNTPTAAPAVAAAPAGHAAEKRYIQTWFIMQNSNKTKGHYME